VSLHPSVAGLSALGVGSLRARQHTLALPSSSCTGCAMGPSAVEARSKGSTLSRPRRTSQWVKIARDQRGGRCAHGDGLRPDRQDALDADKWWADAADKWWANAAKPVSQSGETSGGLSGSRTTGDTKLQRYASLYQLRKSAPASSLSDAQWAGLGELQ